MTTDVGSPLTWPRGPGRARDRTSPPAGERRPRPDPAIPSSSAHWGSRHTVPGGSRTRSAAPEPRHCPGPRPRNTRFRAGPRPRAHHVHAPLGRDGNRAFAAMLTHHDGMRVQHRLIQCCRERHTHEIRWLDALADSTIPTSLVWGDLDTIAPPAVADFVWANYRSSRSNDPLDVLAAVPREPLRAARPAGGARVDHPPWTGLGAGGRRSSVPGWLARPHRPADV